MYFGLIGDKICWSDKEQPVQIWIHAWMKSFHFQIVFLILGKVLALMLFLDYLMVFWALTGYSLSDQHILSPFNPKHDAWICQICEDLHKLFWSSKLAKIVNLTKSVVIIWVKWWQNMLIWQRTTFNSVSRMSQQAVDFIGHKLREIIKVGWQWHFLVIFSTKECNLFALFWPIKNIYIPTT